MGTGYTRNDTDNNIADGNVINAADFDGEFDAIVTAFSTSGHTHDGTSAEGGPVTVLGPAQDFVVSATTVTPKTTNTLDLGTSSLLFKDAFFDGDITTGGLIIDNAGSIGSVSDANAITISSGGVVAVTATTASSSATTGALTVAGGAGVAADLSVGDDLRLISDSSVLSFGADSDTTLTHTDGTGLTLNSTNKLTFGDAASFVQQSSNGVLRIDGEATIDLNASTAVTVSNDLKLDSDAAVLGFGADNDVTLTHVADTGLLLNSTMALQFNDSSQFINAPSATVLDINATDEIELNATLVDINANVEVSGTLTVAGAVDFGDAALSNVGAVQLDSIAGDGDTNTSITFSGSDVITIATGGSTAMSVDANQDVNLTNDLHLKHDAAVLNFGADNDVTLTHVADTGLLLNSTSVIQFNDASQKIGAPNATTLDIDATDEIELNATLVDVNANLDVSGTYTGAGLMTTGGNIVIPDAGNIGSASDTDAIAIASDGVVTLTQKLIGTELDISGNIDVDGTTNLDVVDIDGAVDMASTLAVGGVVTANAGVVVDNITIDGTEIDLSSGDLTLDVAGSIILDADSGDVSLKDNGTETLRYSSSASGPQFFSPVVDKDIIFKGNDGGSTITALTLDMSESGDAAFNRNVGAGITPIERLHSAGAIVSTGSNATGATSGAERAVIDLTSNAARIGHFRGSTSAGSGSLELYTDSSKRLTIDSNGKVGIGTATIGDKLVVQGASSATASIVIQDPTADDHGTHLSYDDANSQAIFGGLTNGTKNPALRVARDAASGIDIDSSGNVGIGDTTPSQKLDVNGNIRVTSGFVEFSGDTSTPSTAAGIHRPADNTLAFVTANSEAMRIDSNGKVGINETSPDRHLHVKSGTDNVVAKFESTDSVASIEFVDSGGGSAEIGAEGNSLVFFPAGAEKMRMSQTEAVFNDLGLDYDFRVESDGNANMFVVDAGNNRVNIGEVNTLFNATATVTRNDTASLSDFEGNLMLFDNAGSSTSTNGGHILFSGHDGTSVRGFAKIIGGKGNSTSGEYDGALFFKVRDHGDSSILEKLRIKSGETTFNELSGNQDFRVESDGNANMIFVDGGNDHVCIGTSTDFGGVLNIKTTDNTANLVLGCTDTDANAGPILVLKRDVTGADDDFIGTIKFNGQDNAGNDTTYVRLDSQIKGASNGSESSEFFIKTLKSGSEITPISCADDQITINEDSETLDFRVESNDDANMFFVDAADNRIGIRTNDPASTLHIDSDNASGTTYGIVQNDGTANTNTIAGWVIRDGTTIMGGVRRRRDGSGSPIEVGNFSDDATVDLLQNNERRITLNTSSHIIVNEPGLASDFRVESDSNTHMLFVDGANNAVGINDSTPNSYPANNQTGTATDGGIFRIGGSVGAICASATGNELAYTRSGFNYISSPNGGFSIRAGSSGGVSLSSGATSWTSVSDERLKTLTGDIENAIDKVKTLRTKMGHYNDDSQKVSHPFLIAQDVKAVLPEAVSVIEDDPDAEDTTGISDKLSLSYTDVIPLLTAALKESIAKNEKLEARITALENA
jgi:cytoskeletal protein CcmA (bactofilin family)